jgi:hypothetical protein
MEVSTASGTINTATLTVLSPVENNVFITSLVAGTLYDIYARALCLANYSVYTRSLYIYNS